MRLPPPVPDPVGPGQESVWTYPRPAIIRRSTRHVRIVFGGVVIADSRRAWRALETSHPPTWYIRPDDVRMEFFHRSPGSGSVCEWKGPAIYYDIDVPPGGGHSGGSAKRAAWSYPRPTPGFAEITDYIAVYPALMDACTVDGETARPQEGGFYGGWITSDLAGPFKGPPGTEGW
ncbi:DUF427 domain-containing protein [Alsobacter sp. R-9]